MVETNLASQKLIHSNQVLHTGWDLTPQRLLALFTMAESGDLRPQCDAIDDLVERDPTLQGLIETRTDTLAGKYTEILDGADDADSKYYAAVMRNEIWPSLDTSTLVRHLAETTNLHGFGASEIAWSYLPEQGRVDPVGFWHSRCRDFYVATTYFRRVPGAVPDELLVRRSDHDFTGERLIPDKWIVTKRKTSIPLARAGLGRPSAFLVLLKNMAVTDWAVYVNRFGLPFVVVTIDDWTNEAERAQAEEIIRAVGNDSGVVIARKGGPALDMKDAVPLSRNSSTDMHSRLATYADMQNTKLWAGATLASESGEGAHSYAQANVHKDARTVRIEADAVLIENAINRDLLAPWWRINNLPGKPGRVKFNLTEISDPKAFVEVAKTLVDMGVPLSRSHILNQTGMRLGIGDDAIMKARE